MGTIRKLKQKAKQSTIKRGVIYIGDDQDNEPILVNAKTRGIKNKEVLDIQSKIMQEYKIPVREKKPMELSKVEKEIYNLANDNDNVASLILVYDETKIETMKVKSEIDIMMMASNIVTYFDMDEIVLDEEGNEKTQWDIWGITKNNWYGLCKYIIDEEKGLGLDLGSLNMITQELTKIKEGSETVGEGLLKAMDFEDVAKETLAKATEELEAEEVEE